jgi:hypothetical protein
VEQLYQRRGSLPADVEEAGSVEGASMLADDIADRIAIACPGELDGIIKDMWVDHTHGLLTDNEMETLDEAARARREAIQARRTETRIMLPAVDLGGRVWLGGKPCKGGPAAPAFSG